MSLIRKDLHEIGTVALQLGFTSVPDAVTALQRGAHLEAANISSEDIARWRRNDFDAYRRIVGRGHQ